MCRWFVYRGAPLRTSELLLHPVHSIVAQSLSSPLGAEPVNGDGFGFGWYPASGDGPPGVFRSIEPAWHDRNLRSLSEAIESPLFFCHVRAAAGPPIQQTNCHPFRYDGWLFMHNGGIADFARVKRELVLGVDPELYPLMLGTTDSEVLFHLALTLGLREDPVGARDRFRREGWARPRRSVPVPGQRRRYRRRLDLGRALLLDGQVAVAVSLDRDHRPARDVPG